MKNLIKWSTWMEIGRDTQNSLKCICRSGYQGLCLMQSLWHHFENLSYSIHLDHFVKFFISLVLHYMVQLFHFSIILIHSLTYNRYSTTKQNIQCFPILHTIDIFWIEVNFTYNRSKHEDIRITSLVPTFTYNTLKHDNIPIILV